MITEFSMLSAIARHWDRQPELSGVTLFADRNSTDASPPYAIMSCVSNINGMQTRGNTREGSSYRTITVQFKAYGKTKKLASQLGALIESIYDDAEFIVEGGKLLKCEVPNAGTTHEEEQNLWMNLFSVTTLSSEDRIR